MLLRGECWASGASLGVGYRNARDSMVPSGGDQLVLVDQPAQPLATGDPLGTRRWPRGLTAGQRRVPLKRTMRPGSVVVGDVLPQHLLQVPWSQEEQPVQAFPTHGPHPALGNHVRPGRSDWDPQDTHVFGPEHRVEGGRELGIPVADQLMLCRRNKCTRQLRRE